MPTPEPTAQLSPKSSLGRSIWKRLVVLAVVINLFLSAIGVISHTVEEIRRFSGVPHNQEPPKTFLVSMKDYVTDLATQLDKVTPQSVGPQFYARLRSCKYDLKGSCSPCVAGAGHPASGLPDTSLCDVSRQFCEERERLIPSGRRERCEVQYRICLARPASPTGETNCPPLMISRGLFPIPSWRTVMGIPDATLTTLREVYRAGWLAFALVVTAIVFVGASLVTLFRSNPPPLLFSVYLVFGVPFLIGGVAWLLLWPIWALLYAGRWFLSLLIIGTALSGIATIILESKHLAHALSSRTKTHA